MGNIGDYIVESLKKGKNNRLDNEFFNGYYKAASICIEAITKRSDELHKQIKDGKFLSNQEQFLLTQLNELKEEIIDRLRKFDDREG